VQQAAERLGVSGQYLRRLILRGDMKTAVKMGNAWFLEARGLKLPKAKKPGRKK